MESINDHDWNLVSQYDNWFIYQCKKCNITRLLCGDGSSYYRQSNRDSISGSVISCDSKIIQNILK